MKRQIPIAAVIAPALLIVAVVGYFLLVKPKQDESGRLGETIAELESKIDLAIAAQRRPAGQPEVTIRVADVFQLTKAMPDRTDMPGIILELDAVAAQAGVSFSSIAPGPAIPGTGFSRVPINLTFEGNYFDLTDFLFRLRNLVMVRDGKLRADGRLFSLANLSLQEGAAKLPQVQAALTVDAYIYAGAPATAGAAPAAAPPPTTTTPAPTDSAAAGGTG